jgi:predicted nuclease of predicted toxin-antitoxin system
MIRVLIDANLSWRLSKLLSDLFDCIPSNRTGLPIPASDKDLWHYAQKNNIQLIITNDEDFEQLSRLWGWPPKVVLLRTGNQTTQYYADLLRRKFDTINDFLDSEELSVLEISDSRI